MIPITVLIPCKNEQSNLAACIASARLIAAEILLADSGSTDASIEMGRASGCRVIERDYGNSGDFKNWAIPQSRHEWVFVLDADERITEELAAEIHQLLAAEPSKKAYALRRLNYFLGHPIRHGDWARDRVIRLLRRDECRYGDQTDHAEITTPSRDVGLLQNPLIHFTAWDLKVYLEKMTHYAFQQGDYWHARGKRIRWIHVALNGPMRFLRSFILRQGFRDGKLGLLVAFLTAYYSFLKQARLWQRQWGKERDVVDTFALLIHDQATSESASKPWHDSRSAA